MQTESYGQMIDRLIIANLKHWHYTQDGRENDAECAKDQACRLSAAIEVYNYECRTGQRRPAVQLHLRYHNHNDVEAKADSGLPKTIGECISLLVSTHSDYWRAQSRIQELKGMIDKAAECETVALDRELVELQRTHIDLDNQRRNELVQHIDELYQ